MACWAFWALYSGPLKGIDQDTLCCDCRTSWHICNDTMIVDYWLELYSDNFSVLFDWFLNRIFKQISLNNALLQSFVLVLHPVLFTYSIEQCMYSVCPSLYRWYTIERVCSHPRIETSSRQNRDVKCGSRSEVSLCGYHVLLPQSLKTSRPILAQ